MELPSTKLQDIIPWKYKKGKMSQTEVSLSWNVLRITIKLLKRESERERAHAAEAKFVACKQVQLCWGRCDCICSLKRLDLAQSAVKSASIRVFHSAHVSSAPSCILVSQQEFEHPSLRRGNVHASFCFPHEKNARRDDGERNRFFCVPAISHP